MGKVYYNGLHWNSPVGDTPRQQYTRGQQFAAAMIIAAGDVTPRMNCGCSTSRNFWETQVDWIRHNTSRTADIVLRLFWPKGNCMQGNCGPYLGEAFYNSIVKTAVQQYGIRNFQVLNELNREYEPSKSRQFLGGDMYNIAWQIKHMAVNDGIGDVYLGFPGPGGPPGEYDPNSTDWNAYWDFYKYYITLGTDQGPAYNWLALHAYENSWPALAQRMKDQYDNLVSRIPNYPFRWTEYGIPLEVYCQFPCTMPCYDPGTCPTKFEQRANDCRSVILNVKSYVENRNPPGPDVWGVFNYIAYDSDLWAQDEVDTRYELVFDNSDSHSTPAQNLANAF